MLCVKSFVVFATTLGMAAKTAEGNLRKLQNLISVALWQIIKGNGFKLCLPVKLHKAFTRWKLFSEIYLKRCGGRDLISQLKQARKGKCHHLESSRRNDNLVAGLSSFSFCDFCLLIKANL